MSNRYANDYISAKLWDKGYGKGYSYQELALNDEDMWGIKNLRKAAQTGDHVLITVCSARGYWVHDYLDFYIKGPDNSDLVQYHQNYLASRRAAPKRPRDSKKQKVYVWQDKYLPQGQLDLSQEQCQAIVDDIFYTYGFVGREPTVIVSKQNKACSTYNQMSHEIKLAQSWGRRERTVIHEAAHALIKVMDITGIAAHGKEFVALYMELCELFLTATPKQLTEARVTGELLGTMHSIS